MENDRKVSLLGEAVTESSGQNELSIKSNLERYRPSAIRTFIPLNTSVDTTAELTSGSPISSTGISRSSPSPPLVPGTPEIEIIATLPFERKAINFEKIKSSEYTCDIAYMHASPPNIPRLNTKREIQLLYAATSRERELRVITANLTIMNLNSVLRRKVKCVHISCSDTGEGKGFVFENDDGSMKLMSIDEMCRWFKFGNNLIQLVFLSACRSLQLGNNLVGLKIPHVVVIPGEVRDDLAIEFSHLFYSSLCNHSTIKSALDHANSILKLKDDEKFLLLPQSSTVHDRILFRPRRKAKLVSTTQTPPSVDSLKVETEGPGESSEHKGYQNFIKSEAHNLKPGNYIICDENGNFKVFETYAQAHPFVENHRNLYGRTYMETEFFPRVQVIPLTLGGGDVMSEGSLAKLKHNLNPNNGRIKLRVIFKPLQDEFQCKSLTMEAQSLGPGYRYFDVNMLIITSLPHSIGPRAILSQLGLEARQAEYSLYFRRNMMKVSVRLALLEDIKGTETFGISIPVEMCYRDYGDIDKGSAEELPSLTDFKVEWKLGQDFLQYCLTALIFHSNCVPHEIVTKTKSSTAIELAKAEDLKEDAEVEDSQMEKNRMKYEQYIASTTDLKIGTFILVDPDLPNGLQTYDSYLQAHPYMEAHATAYGCTYPGEERVVRIKPVSVTGVFGGNPVFTFDSPRPFTSNYAYVKARIIFKTSRKNFLAKSFSQSIGSDIDVNALRKAQPRWFFDVDMMIDTGAQLSLGPQSVLTGLGRPTLRNELLLTGYDGSASKSAYVPLSVCLLDHGSSDSSLAGITIPIFMYFRVETQPPTDIEQQKKRIEQDISHSDVWLLGQDVLKFYQHLWTGNSCVDLEIMNEFLTTDEKGVETFNGGGKFNHKDYQMKENRYLQVNERSLQAQNERFLTSVTLLGLNSGNTDPCQKEKTSSPNDQKNSLNGVIPMEFDS